MSTLENVVKPVRVFFVNDSSANPNWGSRATSHSLKNSIHEAGGDIIASFPLAELAHPNWQSSKQKKRFYEIGQKLSLNSAFLHKANSSLLNQLIRYLPDSAPEDWPDFAAKARAVMQGYSLEHVKAALESCDLVVINGEGGILENQRESRMMFFIAYLAKKHFAKPVVMLNHSAELSHPVLQRIAEEVYPLLDDVIFRDVLSFEAYKAISNGRLAADVTFSYQPAPFETWLQLAQRPGYFDHFPGQNAHFDPGKPFICLGGSSSFSPRHKHSYNPQKALSNLAQSLGELAQVVIVASASPDEKLLRPIAEALALPCIPLTTAPLQGLDLLANASLYVGGRWHGAIFSLTGGTPVVSFSAETFKLDALMQDFGLAKPCDALSLDKHLDSMLDLAKNYISQGLGLRNSLKHKAQQRALSTQEHIHLLTQLAASQNPK